MNTTDPKIIYRPEVYTAGIRMQVPIPFGKYLTPAWRKTEKWLDARGVQGFGPAIIRYHTTDMEKLLEIDVAFITPTLLQGDDKITTGTLPAGDYAVLDHYGSYKGKGVYLANVKIIEWAKANQIRWDVEQRGGEEWWAGRVEWYWNDPAKDPDPQNYRTELTFKVQPGQA